MSETIYLVQGATGEYSDHREWIVAAYRDQEQARDIVVKLTATAKNLDYYARDYKKQTEIMAEAGDPSFQLDYTGTEYSLYEVELR